MEAKVENNQAQEGTVVVLSKKIQINSVEHELVKDLLESSKKPESITSIKIEGNSYSLQFCEAFGNILKTTTHLKVTTHPRRTSTSTTPSLGDSRIKSLNRLSLWLEVSLAASSSDWTSATMQLIPSVLKVFSFTFSRPPLFKCYSSIIVDSDLWEWQKLQRD
jgi:hypothetical protein